MKVLVVDGDSWARDLLARIVKRGGYEVYLAESGDQGIDIAAREQAEVILLDYMRLCQYEQLIRLSQDVMLCIDAGGRIAFSNQAGIEVFGETAGRPFAQLIAGQQGSPNEWRALFNEATPRVQVELQFVRADGYTFPGELSLCRLSEHKLISATAIIRDRSETRFLRDRIEQAQQAETTARAAQRVAHDLSNYLFALRAANDSARDQIPDDSVAVHYLNDGRDILAQADGLVRALSRLGTPNLGARSRQGLNECVRSAKALLTHLADGAHISFEIAAPEDLSVSLDPVGVVQVLANLVCNARDAAGDHGRIVVRTCQSGAGGASSVVDNSSGWGCIEVIDNGWMNTETASRLFEPGFTTQTSNRELHGFGLKTSRHIVESNGGRIAVRSSECDGTTFSVCFPRA